MVAARKKLEAMRNNPRGDWKIEDLHAVAADWGIEIRNAGGSHHIFSHPDIDFHLSVPAHRPIKSVYIRKFIDMIDEINDKTEKGVTK